MKFQPKNNTCIFIVACILLIGLLYVMSKKKDISMLDPSEQEAPMEGDSGPVASSPSATHFASARGIQTTTHGMTSPPKMPDPSSLLPSDANSKWASLNPSGNGPLKGVNLLQAGSLIGINTQGSSMRNSNLQVRSEPPIQKKNIGPWMNSTIEEDKFRRPLEIGSGNP